MVLFIHNEPRQLNTYISKSFSKDEDGFSTKHLFSKISLNLSLV